MKLTEVESVGLFYWSLTEVWLVLAVYAKRLAATQVERRALINKFAALEWRHSQARDVVGL